MCGGGKPAGYRAWCKFRTLGGFAGGGVGWTVRPLLARGRRAENTERVVDRTDGEDSGKNDGKWDLPALVREVITYSEFYLVRERPVGIFEREDNNKGLFWVVNTARERELY